MYPKPKFYHKFTIGHFTIRRLTQNMRAGLDQKWFGQFLIKMGNGTLKQYPEIDIELSSYLMK